VKKRVSLSQRELPRTARDYLIPVAVNRDAPGVTQNRNGLAEERGVAQRLPFAHTQAPGATGRYADS
jgi:hypothetical protein